MKTIRYFATPSQVPNASYLYLSFSQKRFGADALGYCELCAFLDKNGHEFSIFFQEKPESKTGLCMTKIFSEPCRGKKHHVLRLLIAKSTHETDILLEGKELALAFRAGHNPPLILSPILCKKSVIAYNQFLSFI